MPLTVAALGGAAATGPALSAPLPMNAAQQISNAIGQVTAGNMFGAPGTFIANVFGWRVDRQNAAAGYVNVSVQRNGVPAPSTVASVMVPGALNQGPAPTPAVTQARKKELERLVRNGLERSFASYGPTPPPLPMGAPPGASIITRFQVGGAYSA